MMNAMHLNLQFAIFNILKTQPKPIFWIFPDFASTCMQIANRVLAVELYHI